MTRLETFANKLTLRWWLAPIAWMYAMVVAVRNILFDWKILSSTEYDIPIISVGNITVGGTGKTPHIEYLVQLLSPHYRVAVLSRGYKRKTSGYVLSTTESTASQIGDEPYQIKRKFPDITVAVDANRRRGIEHLMKLDPAIDVILLDDAFQHRYVKPTHSILLIDYNRPITEDWMLPVGNLRESITSKYRANTVIVSKCPLDLKPMEFRVISKLLNVAPYQQLYFTGQLYSHIEPVFPESAPQRVLNKLEKQSLLLVSGIATPQPFVQEMGKYSVGVPHLMQFPDHHNFTKGDLSKITTQLAALKGGDAIVVTTEKDAVRLKSNKYLSDELKSKFYYLPLQIQFIQPQQEELFNNKLLKHVREYKKDRAVLK